MAMAFRRRQANPGEALRLLSYRHSREAFLFKLPEQ